MRSQTVYWIGHYQLRVGRDGKGLNANETHKHIINWLRLRTGSTWTGSVAHASSNVTEDGLHRLAFRGRADGIPSDAANIVSVVSEAVVLVGIVAADFWKKRHDRSAPSNKVHTGIRKVAA
ncbi:MAG TPA: hypothetical protein VF898_10735 [Chloroflexota bacterium]